MSENLDGPAQIENNFLTNNVLAKLWTQIYSRVYLGESVDESHPLSQKYADKCPFPHNNLNIFTLSLLYYTHTSPPLC